MNSVETSLTADTPTEKAAKLLEEMAERIRRNAADPIGGCFVVIPPKDSGEPFSYLGLDSMQDPVLFYSLLSSRLKAILEGLDTQQRRGAFGR